MEGEARLAQKVWLLGLGMAPTWRLVKKALTALRLRKIYSVMIGSSLGI